MPEIIRAEDVVKVYFQGHREIPALGGLNLQVHQGEFLAVTGPSGSGKSTLLHVLGGLDRADKGKVWFEGRSLSSLSDEDLALIRRRRIGFVLQFFNLLPTLTAEENVAFPLALDGKEDAQTRSIEMLNLVGLSDRAAHQPAELSGGEQQRVALARALAIRPALVLADEPTGNLDSASGSGILQLMRRAADAGQTIVMVTHDERIASYADRTVRLVDGLIVEKPESMDL